MTGSLLPIQVDATTMDTNLLHLVLLAQQDRFERGQSIFQWGLTMAGAGILMAAIGILFSKSKAKEGAQETPPAVKFLAAAVIAAVGIGLIAYAWLGF